jgi:hypothetical protein
VKRTLILVVLASMLFLAVSCIGLPPEGNIGVISVVPYVNKELGLRGIVPAEWEEFDQGNFARANSPIDQSSLILASALGMSMDEAKTYAASQLGLDELPESLESYKSPYLLWDLYEVDLDDPGVGTLKMNIALTDSGSMVYGVLVIALARDYEAEKPFHETVFIHAVHALMPLE